MFISNKYTKWYYQIITKAQARVDSGEYTERHHILPTALGGANTCENKVRLTAREHFVCHLLLTKMVTNAAKSKMLFALSMLTNVKNIGEGRYTPSSRLYEYARKGHSAAIKAWWTPERRLAASISRTGHTRLTPESKERIRQWQLGKTWTDKALQNRTEMSKQNAINRRGTKWSPEQRAKMEANPARQHRTVEQKRVVSEALKGRKLSSGRRVGHWFRSPTGEEILFCPMKLSAAEHALSLFCLNNLIKGKTDVYKGWTYIRSATQVEMDNTK